MKGFQKFEIDDPVPCALTFRTQMQYFDRLSRTTTCQVSIHSNQGFSFYHATTHTHTHTTHRTPTHRRTHTYTS